jgi:phospholipase C
VPLLLISPYARKGFVDSTFYDTTSLLKFIETRWNLEPLAERDVKAPDLTNPVDFRQESAPARAPAPVTGEDQRIIDTASAASATTPQESGDGDMRTLAIGLLAAALIGIGIILLARRRRSRNHERTN